MKNACLIWTLSFIMYVGFSQNKTGIVHYGELQSLGLGSPIGKDYSAMLVFDVENSIYITRQDSLEQLSQNNQTKEFYFATSKNKEGFQYYNNLKDKTFYSRDIGFNYVREETPIINWTILNEIKTLGNLECQKATATFRGRNYTAWFTRSIPLPYGPWKLQGLPGLILEAFDTHKEIFWYFKELQYPAPYAYLLKPIQNTNQPWISFLEYKDLQLKAFKHAVISSRIVAEKAGIKLSTPKDMSSDFIEVFDVE